MESLYNQMSPASRSALALLLGFNAPDGCFPDRDATVSHRRLNSAPYRMTAGFRLTLREIAPLPGAFTLGDALRAYCAHVARPR